MSQLRSNRPQPKPRSNAGSIAAPLGQPWSLLLGLGLIFCVSVLYSQGGNSIGVTLFEGANPVSPAIAMRLLKEKGVLNEHGQVKSKYLKPISTREKGDLYSSSSSSEESSQENSSKEKVKVSGIQKSAKSAPIQEKSQKFVKPESSLKKINEKVESTKSREKKLEKVSLSSNSSDSEEEIKKKKKDKLPRKESEDKKKVKKNPGNPKGFLKLCPLIHESNRPNWFKVFSTCLFKLNKQDWKSYIHWVTLDSIKYKKVPVKPLPLNFKGEVSENKTFIKSFLFYIRVCSFVYTMKEEPLIEDFLKWYKSLQIYERDSLTAEFLISPLNKKLISDKAVDLDLFIKKITDQNKDPQAK